MVSVSAREIGIRARRTLFDLISGKKPRPRRRQVGLAGPSPALTTRPVAVILTRHADKRRRVPFAGRWRARHRGNGLRHGLGARGAHGGGGGERAPARSWRSPRPRRAWRSI